MAKEKLRSEIKDCYKWDLKDVFNNGKDFGKACKEAQNLIKKVKTYKGKLTENSVTLLEFLELQVKIEILLEKIYAYGNYYCIDIDTRSSEGQKTRDKAIKVYIEYIDAASFVEPELLSKDITKLIKENPKLKLYERHLNDIIRFKPYILSLKEEELLAKLEDITGSGYNIYKNLINADANFGKIKDENNNSVELTAGNYLYYIQSKNRNVRKNAYNKRNGFYKKFYNTLASTYKDTVKENICTSKIRNYKDPLERDAFGINISRSVFETLIRVVGNGTTDLKRFYNLKRKLLNLQTLHKYDFLASPELNFKDTISYDDAISKIKKALEIFGEEYTTVLNKFLNNNMIDVYPSKGKATGGYQVDTYKDTPKILYNYQETYTDLYGVAHEIGHAMHSYHSHKQPYIYSNYNLLTAETASLTNEIVVTNYLLKNAKTKDEKIYILIKHLDQLDNYLYATVVNATHEHTMYEKELKGESISNEDVCEIHYDLKKKYYEDTNIIIDEVEKYSFMRYPHYHRSYYFYKYSVSLCAAIIIGNNIETSKKYKEKYISFLSSGCSLEVEDLYKLVDIDLTDEKTYLNAINYFKEKVDELETLINS